MVNMRGTLAMVCLLLGCGGGDEDRSIGYACDQVSTAVCIRADECGLLGGASQAECFDELVAVCCEDDRRCDDTAAASDDQIDECAQAVLEFGCDLIENGERPADCEPLFEP